MSEPSRPRLGAIQLPSPPKRPRTNPQGEAPAAAVAPEAVERTSPPDSARRKTRAASTRAANEAPRSAGTPLVVAGRPKVISARVPKELYDALARHVASLELSEGRPAYSQVVAVACEDHHDAVVETAVQAALETRRDWRAPRGARKAANATMLTLRFWPAELAALESAQSSVSTSKALDDELRAKITRTAVIIAALQVSLRNESDQKS